MSADLVASIELLQEQKRTALAEVARIDNELERARLAIQDLLGGRPVRERARPLRPNQLRLDGSVPNVIVAALAASEPRTLKDLTSVTGLHPGTVYTTCVRMVRAGRLFRARLHNSGKAAIYARTSEALGAALAVAPPSEPAAPEEGAADAG